MVALMARCQGLPCRINLPCHSTLAQPHVCTAAGLPWSSQTQVPEPAAAPGEGRRVGWRRLANTRSAPARMAFALCSLRGGSADEGPEREDVGPLRVMRLTQAATLPERGTHGAVGYDLFASEDIVVASRGSALVATGIAMSIPRGCYGRVAPRSGLAVKHSIDVGAGVVDPDYRGEVKVLLFNFGDCDFKVEAGMRVAQMIVERCATPVVLEVDSLEDTSRGAAGFGSTGQ